MNKKSGYTNKNITKIFERLKRKIDKIPPEKRAGIYYVFSLEELAIIQKFMKTPLDKFDLDDFNLEGKVIKNGKVK